MKKIFITIIAVLISIISLNNTKKDTLVTLDSNIAESVFRFHIIANSDDESDQQLKLKVRDSVAKTVAHDMKNMGIQSKEEAQNYIKNNIDKYTNEARQVIRSEGYSYTAEGSIGKSWFPVKIYGNYIFPEGEYDAFRLSIGKAEGKNWWCVLFPSLCMVDESYQITEGSETDTLQKDCDRENVKFRLRIVEWIQDMW